ncbi:MAG: hypothetical protein MR355_00425 [Lachnospiraceae bacterium]|nr:hypothetical protein [Lachnospiraceae bacterium]
MRKKKMALGLVVSLVLVMLCGCGEQLYELTEDETNSIAAYTAHVISKHNTSQLKGVVTMTDSQPEPQDESLEDASTETEPAQEEVVSGGEDTPESQDTPLVSLQEALAIEGVNVSFQSYEVKDYYIEGKYYAINAPAGSKLLILHFALSNSGDTDVACDVLSRSISFQVTVNDTYQKKSDVTILLDDLSTYQGTIAAGTSQNAVLLFTMSTEELNSVEQLLLKVTEGERTQMAQLK